MIIKPFSRRLKAAAETIAKAPSSMILPPSSFFVASTLDNENDTIGSIQDFVARIPQAVQQRKARDIQPGAVHDPVAKLFR